MGAACGRLAAPCSEEPRCSPNMVHRSWLKRPAATASRNAPHPSRRHGSCLPPRRYAAAGRPPSACAAWAPVQHSPGVGDTSCKPSAPCCCWFDCSCGSACLLPVCDHSQRRGRPVSKPGPVLPVLLRCAAVKNNNEMRCLKQPEAGKRPHAPALPTSPMDFSFVDETSELQRRPHQQPAPGCGSQAAGDGISSGGALGAQPAAAVATLAAAGSIAIPSFREVQRAERQRAVLPNFFRPSGSATSAVAAGTAIGAGRCAAGPDWLACPYSLLFRLAPWMTLQHAGTCHGIVMECCSAHPLLRQRACRGAEQQQQQQRQQDNPSPVISASNLAGGVWAAPGIPSHQQQHAQNPGQGGSTPQGTMHYPQQQQQYQHRALGPPARNMQLPVYRSEQHQRQHQQQSCPTFQQPLPILKQQQQQQQFPTNAIIVSTRQEGNPVLKYIR